LIISTPQRRHRILFPTPNPCAARTGAQRAAWFLPVEESQMTPAASSEDLKARVAQVLAEEVAPALHFDGTLEVSDVSEGVVQLRLRGIFRGGCPSTIWAVVNGLEQELRQRFPEVEYVELLLS
jgi:Fe-S cluster biogenesis protein NfuA